MRVCTIATRNYLAWARVLATSWFEHHPEGQMDVLVFDAEPGEITGEPFDVMTPGELAIPRSEFRRLATIYGPLELSTALKPWVLEVLLDRDDPPVTYLDADIEVFAPLDDIDVLAREAGIVLTPHLLVPMTRDNALPSEGSILHAGVYNLGFLALGSAGELIPWWQARLRRDCLGDADNDTFVDQRWIDFVPGLWDHAILRDVGCNVAYWNVDRRKVSMAGDGYLVDGHPLRFFHFSGFSPETPTELSRYQTRTALDDEPALFRLCGDYARRLIAAGYRDMRSVPYRYGATATGTAIDTTARRAARSALLAAESRGVEPSVPDPFDVDGGDAFVEYMRSPAPGSRVSRYLMTLWERRPDLQRAFPDLTGDDAEGYEAWVDVEGRHQDGVGAEFL